MSGLPSALYLHSFPEESVIPLRPRPGPGYTLSTFLLCSTENGQIHHFLYVSYRMALSSFQVRPMRAGTEFIYIRDWQAFSEKVQIGNSFGFAGHKGVLVTTLQLRHCSLQAVEMVCEGKGVTVSITLYQNRRRAKGPGLAEPWTKLPAPSLASGRQSAHNERTNKEKSCWL